MSWDFSTPAAFQGRLAWVEEFARTNADKLDMASQPYKAFIAAIAAQREAVKRAGYWAPHLRRDVGGQGCNWVEMALMFETLGDSMGAQVAFGCAAPDAPNSHLMTNTTISDAVRKNWLEPLIAGDLTSAFAMTEPGAGSDPSLMRTMAQRRPGGWAISGHKWYITNGGIADFMLVVAVSEAGVPAKGSSSVFLVPADAPGVTVERDIADMEHPAPQRGEFGLHAELRFNNVFVPDDCVIGPVGDGFRLSQMRLGPARIQHCMRWLGQCRLAFNLLCRRSGERFVHGSTLSEKQTVRHWIADCHADIAMARLLVLQTAWKIDTLGPQAARADISMIKFFIPKVLHNVLDKAIQAHGALGISSDTPLERMYRAARATRIFDGPDEVHRDLVAREILRQRSMSGAPVAGTGK